MIKAMLTIRVRRTLLYGLVFFFAVFAVSAVFYLQGWRFDLQKFSFNKVGAMYIRSYPQDAAISIDGKSVDNNSWFLSRGTLISNLYPKNYRVALSKTGYAPWHETITVSPSLVTEIDQAVLVPHDAKPLSPSGASSGITNFWLAGDALLIQDTDNRLAWNSQKISGTTPIGSGESSAYLLTFDSVHETYFIHNFASGANTNLNTLLGKFGVNLKQARVIQHQGKVLISTAARISIWDISKLLAKNQNAENVSIPVGKLAAAFRGRFDPNAVHIAISQFFIAWSIASSSNTTIVIYDPFLEKVTATPTVPNGNANLLWNPQGTLEILQTNGDLFSFDPSSQTLTKTASDVTSLSFNSDGANIAALEHSALEVFFQNADNNYYRFRLPDASNVTGVIWYKDNSHLFLLGNDRVDFLDLQDSGLENLAVINEAKNAQYNPATNTLYFLHNGEMMAMEFPN